MDAYTGFAQVYDLFMDNVPYDEWCAYICETLKKHGIADGPVLDLGCGTGELTRRLAACGYDMTGVDVSVDMLQKAMEKQTDPPILYLLQEMQTLELDGCVRAVCCTCDCVNYVLEPQELSDAFRRVAACLESGGRDVIPVAEQGLQHAGIADIAPVAVLPVGRKAIGVAVAEAENLDHAAHLTSKSR